MGGKRTRMVGREREGSVEREKKEKRDGRKRREKEERMESWRVGGGMGESMQCFDPDFHHNPNHNTNSSPNV
eukprot:1358221-Amorphochlora_amoeboformis.AAC.1